METKKAWSNRGKWNRTICEGQNPLEPGSPWTSPLEPHGPAASTMATWRPRQWTRVCGAYVCTRGGQPPSHECKWETRTCSGSKPRRCSCLKEERYLGADLFPGVQLQMPTSQGPSNYFYRSSIHLTSASTAAHAMNHRDSSIFRSQLVS